MFLFYNNGVSKLLHYYESVQVLISNLPFTMNSSVQEVWRDNGELVPYIAWINEVTCEHYANVCFIEPEDSFWEHL